jgi:hypothetical protein
MKISKLPKDVRLLALDYQKNQIEIINNKYDKNTDHLCYAFSWNHTMEGFEYWKNWDLKLPIKTKFEYDENGVTKPEQYQIGIDTFERAEANLSKEEILAICKFNIDKYNWRKKDQDKEDFKKIIDYANWAIKNL